MDNKNIITVLAIVVVFIALLNAVVTMIKISNFQDQITGYATTGYVNLTVATNIVLNISPDTTNWGTGVVNTTGGFNNATLTTVYNQTATVVGGNWSTAGVTALAVQNLGTVNVTFNITSNKNASTFIGGSTVTPVFQWNFTNKDSGACAVAGHVSFGQLYDVLTNQTVVCSRLQYGVGKRQIWVDTKIVVPDNSPAETKSAIFTVTGDVAP